MMLYQRNRKVNNILFQLILLVLYCIREKRVDILVLFMILMECLCFSLFSKTLAVGFLYISFIMWRYIFLYSQIFRAFYHERILDFIKSRFCIVINDGVITMFRRELFDNRVVISMSSTFLAFGDITSIQILYFSSMVWYIQQFEQGAQSMFPLAVWDGLVLKAP